MDDPCFYCNDTIVDKYYHGVFILQNEHVEKPLCKDCYHEWLQGING
jgi:hypothetical protein